VPKSRVKKTPRRTNIEWFNLCGDQATHFKVALKALTLKQMQGYVTILFATTCDYMLFATTNQHQIWGGFASILRLMCKYYLFHLSM